jgi:hypothetical protein
MTSRMTLVQAFSSFEQTCMPALVAGASSVFYFRSSPADETLKRRLLVSAHGVAILALYLLAMAIFWTGHSSRNLAVPYELACLVPVALMLVCFLLFRGNRITHVWLIVDTVCLVFVWFFGGMAITDDWL